MTRDLSVRYSSPATTLFAPDTTVTKSGPEGPSAYDVAVENGFIGTEAQWLESLESTVPGPMGTTAWGDLTGVPSTFPPSPHSHAYATEAQGALADSAVQPEDLKTINGASLVGAGDITVSGSSPIISWAI